MSRIVVNDQTAQFVIPTLQTGVPLPKMSKGRKPLPLNPVLADMPPGASFVVSGEAAAKAILADVARARKARTDVLFKTRNLSGAPNPVTFETYPPHTVGVWCVAVPTTTSTETE
jgi:hypothetical protein